MKEEMNLLNFIEQYIKRPVLAELVETNETYLSALSRREALTEAMEDRLRGAVEEIIKDLETCL